MESVGKRCGRCHCKKYQARGFQGETTPGPCKQSPMDAPTPIFEKRYNKQSQPGIGERIGTRYKIQNRTGIVNLSQFLRLNENIGHFLRFERLPRIWNTGRLVYKSILSVLSFIVNTNSSINPTLHYPKAHYSIFQHSIIPIVSKAS